MTVSNRAKGRTLYWINPLITISENQKVPGLRKQPSLSDATTSFYAKWRPRNERRNTILMTHHHQDLVGVSDWLKQISHLGWPLRSTTLIWVVTRNGFSAFGPQTSFCVEIIRWCCKTAAVFLLLLFFFFRLQSTLVMIQSNSHVGSPPTYRKH